MRALGFSAAALAVLVLGGGMSVAAAGEPGVQPGGAGSGESSTGWQPPHIIDSYQGFGIGDSLTYVAGVSCPSTTFCVVADANGNVSSYDGTSWSTAVRIAATYQVIPSVSCASETACVVVTSSGRAIGYDGQGWGKAAIIDRAGQPSGVSCPTADFCIMVDKAGSAFTYESGSWSGPTQIDSAQLTAVSCSTAGSCFAVDSAGYAVEYSNGSWSARTLIDTFSSHYLLSISCPQTDFCAAVDAYGHAILYEQGAWGHSMTLNDGDILTSVSCTSDVFCVVMNQDRESIFDGTSWSPEQKLAFPAYSISCVTPVFCMTFGYQGRGFLYDGSTWSVVSPVLPPNGGVNAISCASSTFCAAVDDSGNAVLRDGKGWSGPDKVDLGPGVVDVSCPSRSFCLAIDNGSSLAYHSSGWSHRKSVGVGALRAVSCVSRVYCVAVNDEYPNRKVYTYDGSSWRPTADLGQANDLADVSCASESACVAIGDRFAFNFDGTSWVAHRIVAERPRFVRLTSVSCVSADFCAAVSSTGQAYTYDGTVWSNPTVVAPMPPRAGDASVSCGAVGMCVMVTARGLASTLAGGNWSSPQRIDPAGHDLLTSVSCPNASVCTAVDYYGYAITYRS